MTAVRHIHGSKTGRAAPLVAVAGIRLSADLQRLCRIVSDAPIGLRGDSYFARGSGEGWPRSKVDHLVKYQILELHEVAGGNDTATPITLAVLRGDPAPSSETARAFAPPGAIAGPVGAVGGEDISRPALDGLAGGVPGRPAEPCDGAAEIREALASAQVVARPGEEDGGAPPLASNGGVSDGGGGSASSGGFGGNGPEQDGPPADADVDPEILRHCVDLPQNDTGNADRLIAHFGADIRHVRKVGWHGFVGTHWEFEGGQEFVKRLAQRIGPLIALEASWIQPTQDEARRIEAAKRAREIPVEDRDDDDKDAISSGVKASAALSSRRTKRRGFAVTSGNDGRLNALMNGAMVMKACDIGAEHLDRDPHALNVENGTLRFVQVQDAECPDPDVVRLKWVVRLDPHTREDMITKCAPVHWDPEATCPQWHAFLEKFQPAGAVRTFLRDFHGYALTGRVDEQALVFNYGTGANGKSTFIEALRRLMGGYAQTLNPESVSGQGQRRGDQATPDLAPLVGVRFAPVSELPRGEPLKEDLVKRLTGGEEMRVRHLNQGFFDFRPIFKAAMSGNDMPTITGTDFGIWRRMRLVPWNVRISEEEKRPFAEMQRIFEAERSGILNWLIEGTLAFLALGRLDTPAEVTSATSDYQHEMDPIQRFLDACVEPAPDRYEYAAALYEAYVSWSEANGLKPRSNTQFGRVLPTKGFKREDGRVRKYLDIRLHDVPDRPDHHKARTPDPQQDWSPPPHDPRDV